MWPGPEEEEYGDYDDEDEYEISEDEMSRGGTSTRVSDPIIKIEGDFTSPELIERMHQFNRENGSISWSMITQDEDLGLSFHERKKQPCFGEMRKYKSTHGDECHKPEGKPGDLHDPFPKGTPVAISIAWGTYPPPIPVESDELDELIYLFWGAKSPWINGFVHPESLDFTLTEDKKSYRGFVLTNTDFDPTVFVNLINVWKKIWGYQPSHEPVLKKYRLAKEAGLEGVELIIAMASVNLMENSNWGQKEGIIFDDGYYTPRSWDLTRLRNQDPKDISGGTFRDRYDYDRMYLHTIFEKDGPSTSEQMGGSYGPVVGTHLECMKKLKEVLSHE